MALKHWATQANDSSCHLKELLRAVLLAVVYLNPYYDIKALHPSYAAQLKIINFYLVHLCIITKHRLKSKISFGVSTPCITLDYTLDYCLWLAHPSLAHELSLKSYELHFHRWILVQMLPVQCKL